MNDLAAERFDLIERGRQIADREVGKRERVAGTLPASMNANGGRFGAGLPALPFFTGAVRQLTSEQPGPEAPCALRVIGGKFDQ